MFSAVEEQPLLGALGGPSDSRGAPQQPAPQQLAQTEEDRQYRSNLRFTIAIVIYCCVCVVVDGLLLFVAVYGGETKLRALSLVVMGGDVLVGFMLCTLSIVDLYLSKKRSEKAEDARNDLACLGLLCMFLFCAWVVCAPMFLLVVAVEYPIVFARVAAPIVLFFFLFNSMIWEKVCQS